MLRPIPNSLLTDTAFFLKATGVDKWQKPTTESVMVRRCHLQPMNEVRKSANNTEVQQTAVLFVEGNSPDILMMEKESEANGQPMRVTVVTGSGRTLEYEVISVDALPDVPSYRTHHYEVSLK